MSIFDSDDFNRRLFFPRDDDSPPPAGARDTFVDGVHVRIHDARDAAALVLLFHGNGEVASDYDELAPWFARELSASLAVVDYRGYGKSAGVPSLRAIVDDAGVIYDAMLREVPGVPVVVLGRSLGSMCAHELYATRSPAGVILESGIALLAGLVERRGLAAAAVDAGGDFDPCAKLARGQAPLLVLHGAADVVIRPREAQVAHAAAERARSRSLVFVEGRGHNDIVGSPAWRAAIGEFAREVMSAPRT